MGEALILLLVTPLAGAFLCLVLRAAGAAWPARIVSVLSVGVVIVLLALLLPQVGLQPEYSLGGWREPVGITLRLDGLGWVASALGALVALAAVVYSLAEGRGPVFYFSFLMLLAGMQGVILTGDLFNMFVFFEILSIATFMLIAEARTEEAYSASLTYLLAGSLGMAFFLLGAYLVYQAAGSFDLTSVHATWSREPTRGLALGLAAMAVGAGLKAAILPLHLWLPGAHASAPHPVSAILSGVMIKVSLFAVVRILAVGGPMPGREALLAAGAAAAVTGVVRALSQTDAKRLLAHHSVSQMGYVVAAWAAGGLHAAAAHAVSHGLFKALLFLVVGAAVTQRGSADLGVGRLTRRDRRWLLPAFVVGALAIAGVPPLNGFVSKTLVSGALEGGWVYWALRAAAVGTVASFLKLSGLFRGGAPDAALGAGEAAASVAAPADGPAPSGAAALPAPAGGSKPLDAARLGSVWALGLACVATGVVPAVRVDRVAALVAPGAFGWSIQAAAESAVTLAAGGLLYALVRSRPGKWALTAIRRREPGLDGALALVVVAFVALTIAIWARGGFLPAVIRTG